jgi:hypothetical protein
MPRPASPENDTACGDAQAAEGQVLNACVASWSHDLSGFQDRCPGAKDSALHRQGRAFPDRQAHDNRCPKIGNEVFGMTAERSSPHRICRQPRKSCENDDAAGEKKAQHEK